MFEYFSFYQMMFKCKKTSCIVSRIESNYGIMHSGDQSQSNLALKLSIRHSNEEYLRVGSVWLFGMFFFFKIGIDFKEKVFHWVRLF